MATTMEDEMRYPKIEGLFKRGDGPKGPGTGKLIIGRFRRAEVALIKCWEVYEKIDGMNMRVIYDGRTVDFRGRTDRAVIPGDLLEYMVKTFSVEKMAAKFSCATQEIPLILYGEGYGPGIQKGGGDYCPSKRFRLFDVKIGETWLEPDSVLGIAFALEIKTAPLLGRWTIEQIIDAVKRGFVSIVATYESTESSRNIEGIVARTYPTLFDRWGNRLIIKLKTKDFDEGA